MEPKGLRDRHLLRSMSRHVTYPRRFPKPDDQTVKTVRVGVWKRAHRHFVAVDEITKRIGQGLLQSTRPLLVNRVCIRPDAWFRGGQSKDCLSEHFVQKPGYPTCFPQLVQNLPSCR